MSADLEACKTAATVPNGPTIKQPVFSIAYRSVVDQALWAVLHGRGLSISSYELGEAVMRVLPDPTAEARWFAGEDVFSGVATDVAGQEKMPVEFAAKMWAVLLAMGRGEAIPSNVPFAKALPRWCFE
jgi:hypothetical protein